jgi:hypothetical protein
VPAVTVIAPVVVFRLNPDGHVPEVATVALPVAPNVAVAPFTVSFDATFVIAVPPVAEETVPLSVTGLMDGGEITVSLSTAQPFVGVLVPVHAEVVAKFGRGDSKSPPPPTCALLSKLPVAPESTFTVKLNVLVPPARIDVELTQTSTLETAEQDHCNASTPPNEMDAASAILIPTGKTSTTPMFALVATLPELLTVSE